MIWGKSAVMRYTKPCSSGTCGISSHVTVKLRGATPFPQATLLFHILTIFSTKYEWHKMTVFSDELMKPELGNGGVTPSSTSCCHSLVILCLTFTYHIIMVSFTTDHDFCVFLDLEKSKNPAVSKLTYSASLLTSINEFPIIVSFSIKNLDHVTVPRLRKNAVVLLRYVCVRLYALGELSGL